MSDIVGCGPGTHRVGGREGGRERESREREREREREKRQISHIDTHRPKGEARSRETIEKISE